MKVELVSVTNHPSKTAEDLITYIARVSNPSNQNNIETTPKLLAYLIKNKHWSPFEMADMTVSIVTSRAIAQQILRHRSFSFQEFSQRYAAVTEFEEVELRRQAEKNRQSSEEVIDPIMLEGTVLQNNASYYIEHHMRASKELYDDLINAGVSKETARFVLPLTTQTTLYMKGSIRSWIHYLYIRADQHTQKEHRLIAEEIKRFFITLFPNISEALEWKKP